MNKYKTIQMSEQNYEQSACFYSLSLEPDFSSFISDIQDFYLIMKKECIGFVELFQNLDYDSSNQILKNIIRFFVENHKSFDPYKIDISLFIQIFDVTHFLEVISQSIRLLIKFPELFQDVILFIHEFTQCNDQFCTYFSDNFLIDFIISLESVLNSENYKKNVKLIIILLSNLFAHADSRNFDICENIQKIYSIIESFQDYVPVLQNEIIIFLANLIKKINIDVRLYQYFIQLLSVDNSVNQETFYHSITALYHMIKKTNDNDFILYIFQSKMVDRFKDQYFANEYSLDQRIFPVYLKTLTEYLKFFDNSNFIKIQEPSLRNELLNIRECILKQFSSKVLEEKLEEIDSKGTFIKHCHSVIKFISVLSEQGCLMEVFKDKKKLFDKILLMYEDVDCIGKEKLIKLILCMMMSNYSKFFLKRIFYCQGIDFPGSFSDFIDNEYERSINVILDIIDLSLKYYFKKNQEIPFLRDLMNSEEFMTSLSEGSQNIENEDLRQRMQATFTQLDDLCHKDES